MLIILHKKIYYLFLITFFSMSSLLANVLLEKPKIISDEEIKALEKNWQTSFTFSKKSLLDITFCYCNQKAGFAIKVLKIPLYSHNYSYLYDLDELKQLFKGGFPAYYLSDPLIHTKARPQKITQEQLLEIVKTKKIIFYTGAGLSASGNVATMNELIESLELKKGLKHFLKNAWKNPEKITHAFSEFCKTAIQSSPTDAHYALKDIAHNKNSAIVTENVDLLQQRTGVLPIFAYSETLHSLKKEDYLAIDYIICVGLSHDDRGFLAKYKENNPQGTIIAIDLKKPKYLSDNDIFIKGDLQKILPFIARNMS